ncbi:MAG: sialate O-acetylesterase [Flavobacteriaceae bacterium]|nr:sialate O-acetylesterase [Flavobacteriaceae bacterium]
MNKFKKIVLCFLMLGSSVVFANISLPSVFGDHMVLQQNAEITLWGWADPLEKVQVSTTWSDLKYETETDNYGNWKVILKTPLAGGPYIIGIKGYNEITITDVLIGEVWLGSGQSNMAWSAASGITDGARETENANIPALRFFTVEKRTANNPQIDVVGKWEVCTPGTMKYFSAVAYFFGKELTEKLKVPVGLIVSAWGGTPAEAWMPEEVFNENEKLRVAADLMKERPWGPHRRSTAFNGMMAPLTLTKLAGVIWYQGEDNTVNPSIYEEVLKELIISWRAQWKDNFPFYLVQIAPYEYGAGYTGVQVREAQRRVRREVPETGMVVTSDIGDIADIHPKNKKDVGLRLGHLALKNNYNIHEELS